MWHWTLVTTYERSWRTIENAAHIKSSLHSQNPPETLKKCREELTEPWGRVILRTNCPPGAYRIRLNLDKACLGWILTCPRPTERCGIDYKTQLFWDRCTQTLDTEVSLNKYNNPLDMILPDSNNLYGITDTSYLSIECKTESAHWRQILLEWTDTGDEINTGWGRQDVPGADILIKLH